MAAAEDDMTVSSRQVENMARRIAQLDYDLAAALERADRSDELMRRAEAARLAAEERASQLDARLVQVQDEADQLRRERDWYRTEYTRLSVARGDFAEQARAVPREPE